jgi:4-diphosphocytidyl-2-C-methyl-D-erythritol kinase
MICFPNAKINLGLHVTGRRPDGYHSIETVFYPLFFLRDALEIVPAESWAFRRSGIPLPTPPQDDLVSRAIQTVRSRHNLPPSAVHLLKNIPAGAGLGGGSSDAAFMLRLMNDFYSLNMRGEALEGMAATLGADCPFFIRNTPVYATGTGATFESLSFSLKGYYACVVIPGIHISTAEAYRRVTPRIPGVSLKEVVKTPVAGWKDVMKNDFETSLLPSCPTIGAIRDQLYASGALYASMSGSGSAVFGLFDRNVSLTGAFPGCIVREGECTL